jgi:hypothetical protein
MDAFNSSDCSILAKALELTGKMVPHIGERSVEDLNISKGALAFAIMDAASNGERNPQLLAFTAVARMNHYEGRLRYERGYDLGGPMVT